jgi:4-hydroxyacetophenone monooxygenase
MTEGVASHVLQSDRVRSELLAATDSEIEDAVLYSDLMSLRGLIYQLTGDDELAAVRTLKSRVFLAEAWNVADEDGTRLIQSKAAEFLKRYRDSGALPIGPGPVERLPRSLALAAGEEIPADELAMWIEETGIDRWSRALKWPAAPTAAQLSEFTVAVIGAGMGGLNAAVQLKHAGVPFFVIEKNAEVGGTWYENRYPGARVDTPSRAYTHIFGADFVFQHPFSPQEDNERYFNWVADRFGVREDIRFNTEVEKLTWDEEAQLWRIRTRGAEGPQEWSVNAVIAATGLLSRPAVPEVPGLERFRGPAFHTARWPADLDVRGKKVAVIGTGATGYQLVPELANIASEVTLFQRKAQWLFPVQGYLAKLPPQVTWLDRNLPYHINFLRFRTNWLTGEHVYGEVFNLDPAWQHEHSRSALNDEIRADRVRYIKEMFADQPELAAKMIPPHPPFSARPILVDTEYNIYHALKRDNVHLVTGGVVSADETGLVASDGSHHEVDVVVFATGFKANDLLWPMEIRGREGRCMEEAWAKDGCRAYVSGSMVPAFPNLFILYGPNTNPANGGGIVNHEEMVTRFALEAIARLILTGERSVEIKQQAFERYNALLDQREALKIYTDARAQNFFMNRHGRSSVMCPFGPSELWRMFNDDGLSDLAFGETSARSEAA